MKKAASTLLQEKRFWEIIESSNKGKDLATELSRLSADEILGYRYWWLYLCRQSYNQALWAVAYTVLGGCSDDGFTDFRSWLLTRGKAVYMKALDNADSLCDEFAELTADEYPAWEEVAYVPMDVFEKKFGTDFYEAEENIDYGETCWPAIEFAWSEDDEESIRKVCPRIFDKWWNNDEF